METIRKSKIIKLISFIISIVVIFILQGCSKDESSIYLEFHYGNIAADDIKSSGLNKAKQNLMGDGLCVVEKGKDVGSDDTITASSSLIFNITDQKVLYADNIYEKRYPASITKIVTSLVILEQIKKKKINLNDEIIFKSDSAGVTENGAKLCGFYKGDKVKLKDLFYALVIYSGNDAGVAIAEHIAGSKEEFAKLMNEESKKLGAMGSNFVNPHGLDNKEHYTTAYDLYLVYNKLLEYDVFREIAGTKSYTITYTTSDGKTKKKKLDNTNQYLLGKSNAPKGITVLGGKTGTTDNAGRCLIMNSRDANGKEYISLILNASSTDNLYTQMTDLLKKIK